jgi:hypothetical protein
MPPVTPFNTLVARFNGFATPRPPPTAGAELRHGQWTTHPGWSSERAATERAAATSGFGSLPRLASARPTKRDLTQARATGACFLPPAALWRGQSVCRQNSRRCARTVAALRELEEARDEIRSLRQELNLSPGEARKWRSRCTRVHSAAQSLTLSL